MLASFYLAVAALLLIALCGGMYRVLRGPTPADRMLAGQLFGTVAVAILALIAQATGEPGLIDVALVFALLAAVSVVAFVRLAWSTSGDRDGAAD